MLNQKPFSPACERNQQPIAEILKHVFKPVEHVLEIGSGTGQHAVYFARAMPWLHWQPTDVADNIPGIQAWINDAELPNLQQPRVLDVSQDNWPEQRYDAVFTANTLHIMAWNCVQRLIYNASQKLELNGYLAIYGPFNYAGNYTSESNARFDQWLKQQSVHSSIRGFEAIQELATFYSLELCNDYPMPANNRILLWKKTS